MTVLLGLMVCCSEQEVMNDATRAKRFAPNQVTGGVDVDPRLDATVLMTEAEVIALASGVLGVDESNPEVTWITSEEFFAGYENVLQITGAQDEIAAYYDTLRVVPTKWLCVVNFTNASALINPDKRNVENWIVGHVGVTIEPRWFEWGDLESALGPTTFDELLEGQDINFPDRPDCWQDDCKHLKYWQGGDRPLRTMCDSDPYTIFYTLCTQEQLMGAYDDCDSLASAFVRAFTNGFIGGEVYPGKPLEPMNPLSTEEDGSYTPAEFMQLEYCEIIPYVERYLGFSTSGHPWAMITSFLRTHGITATAYTGDNEAVVRQAFSEGKIPLLYKDGDWRFVFQYDKTIDGCGNIPTYKYYIDACTPVMRLDVPSTIDSTYTVVLLEY